LTPEVFERFKNGIFPERHELTNMDLFMILKAKNDASAMEFLETLYKTGMARMKVDPEFRKRAEKRTIELQNSKRDE
jgi:hypothetical protein